MSDQAAGRNSKAFGADTSALSTNQDEQAAAGGCGAAIVPDNAIKKCMSRG